MLYMFKSNEFDTFLFGSDDEVNDGFSKVRNGFYMLDIFTMTNIEDCLWKLRRSSYKDDLVSRLYNPEHVSYSFNYIARAIMPCLINLGLDYEAISNDRSMHYNSFYRYLANLLMCDYKFGSREDSKLCLEGYTSLDDCITNMYFFIYQSLEDGKKYFFVNNTKEYDIGDPEKMIGCKIC